MSIEDKLHQLQARIETIAEDESVPGPTGVSLDETLAALTVAGRRRVLMLLEKEALSNDPEQRRAAECIRQLGERVWSGSTYRSVER